MNIEYKCKSIYLKFKNNNNIGLCYYEKCRESWMRIWINIASNFKWSINVYLIPIYHWIAQAECWMLRWGWGTEYFFLSYISI